MAVGFDVGTANLVMSKRGADDKIVTKKERDAFFTIPAAENVTMVLENAGANFILDEDASEVHVIGEDALTFANMFAAEARRPMQNGVLSNSDAQAFPILQLLIEKLVGKAKKKGEILKYSVPAAPINKTFDIVYHESVLNKIFTTLGYDAESINEGMCIVYSELADDRFTGIGLSFGGGSVNCAVSNLGIPVAQFSVVGSGDQIDQKVAETKKGLGLTAARVTKIKESGMSILSPSTDTEEAIAVYYKHMIDYVLKNIADKLSSDDAPQFEDGLNVAVAGGTSLIGDFIPVLKERIEGMRFPVPIKEIRHAKDPLFTVSNGAYISAALKERKAKK